MKVKCFVDRFKNFEMASSNIKTIMIEYSSPPPPPPPKKKKKKNGPYELCDQSRPD